MIRQMISKIYMKNGNSDYFWGRKLRDWGWVTRKNCFSLYTFFVLFEFFTMYKIYLFKKNYLLNKYVEITIAKHYQLSKCQCRYVVQQSYDAGMIVIPISQMMNPRHTGPHYDFHGPWVLWSLWDPFSIKHIYFENGFIITYSLVLYSIFF